MKSVLNTFFRKLSTPRLILLGFAAVILVGTLLLTLPISSQDRVWTNPLDALFTATSAVCVTGLVVHDTATYWSIFGKVVIIALIQVGGMGVVTVAVALSRAAGVRLSLKQRSIMQESVSAHQLGGILSLTRFIVRGTILIEAIGAVLMMPVFIPEFGLVQGLAYSVFHAISAFCNAGFDLMGVKEKYSSLVSYIGNPLLNFTVMALIIVGGIGFLVWEDIFKYKWKWKRYRLQTKVVLTTSAVLIVVPAVIFFFCEFGDLPILERILASLFQSVTTRTAGFNTADLTKLSEPGQGMMMFLMLVGGSPGSTAGGLKTTTLAVLACTAVAVFRRETATGMFGRRLEPDTVRSASAIFAMYLTLFVGGAFLISRVENLPLVQCLFETASAVGTVGLTLGLTPTLGAISKIVLALLMYFGRVGGLTLIFAAVSESRSSAARLPVDKLVVG